MIRSILKTLYWNQWLALALFFVIGDFIYHWVLDIAFHDTYFVITDHSIGIFIGGFFLLLWSLFRFIPAFRSVNWLAHLHISGSTLLTLTIFVSFYIQTLPEPARRYSDYSVYTEFDQQSMWLNFIVTICFLLFVVLQFSWFIQLIVWYYYRSRKA